MRVHIVTAALWLAVLVPAIAGAEYAKVDEPLKKVYQLHGDYTGTFEQTGEAADGFSVVCDMGQAIPDKKHGDDWYVNRPIPGATFELRARIMFSGTNGLKPGGFVVIVKNGEILKVFRPLGEMQGDVWNGDQFNTWGYDTDIEVFNERFGAKGYAKINLIKGAGFYHNAHGEPPEYFLSNCRKIKKSGLPVYDWTDEDDLAPKAVE